MGEGKRLVVVEGVNDVGVGEGFEDEEVRQAGPVCAGGNDGVVRGDLSDSVNDGGLNAEPAVGIVLFRLVHDLEKDVVGIGDGEVLGEGAPERDEVADAGGSLEELGLVFAGGMDIDDDGEMVVEHDLDDAIELGAEVGWFAGILPGEQRAGVDAETDVVEAHAGDESDVGFSGEGLQPMAGVVVGLGKPLAGIDAVLEMLGALEGDGFRGGILGGS